MIKLWPFKVPAKTWQNDDKAVHTNDVSVLKWKYGRLPHGIRKTKLDESEYDMCPSIQSTWKDDINIHTTNGKLRE
jgi:hypothetical protein